MIETAIVWHLALDTCYFKNNAKIHPKRSMGAAAH